MGLHYQHVGTAAAGRRGACLRGTLDAAYPSSCAASSHRGLEVTVREVFGILVRHAAVDVAASAAAAVAIADCPVGIGGVPIAFRLLLLNSVHPLRIHLRCAAQEPFRFRHRSALRKQDCKGPASSTDPDQEMSTGKQADASKSDIRSGNGYCS